MPAALAAVVLAGCGGTSSPSGDPDVEAAAPSSFWAGEEVAGLELTEVLGPPNGALGSSSFLYGTCELPLFEEGGCAPPLEIQSWSLCSRLPAVRFRDRLVDLRGAKALPGRGATIELYTGEHTVVIFANGHAVSRAALRALRPLGEKEPPGRLEPPSPAALRGEGPCESRYLPD